MPPTVVHAARSALRIAGFLVFLGACTALMLGYGAWIAH